MVANSRDGTAQPIIIYQVRGYLIRRVEFTLACGVQDGRCCGVPLADQICLSR